MAVLFQNRFLRFIVSAAIGAGIYFITPACFEKFPLVLLLVLLFVLINAAEYIARYAVITHISRILVGGLFIFSGFIKANDPLGFSYKLEEYFQVFGMEWLQVMALALAIIICAIEIILGFQVLLGARINLALWLLLLMIVFFTFLTFYSACYNKVTDCGCFGDFLHLKPWQSFWKDIILLVLIVLLFVGRNNLNPLFGSGVENFVMLLVILASLAFPLYTYNYLPILDFRPYKKGTNLLEAMKGTPDELKYFYVLKDKSTGNTEKFDHWPPDWDKKYDFVKSETEVVKPGIAPKILDFSIINADGANYTEDILSNPDYNFIIVMYDLKKTNRDVQGKINDFVALAQKEKLQVIGLTASSQREISEFRHDVQAMYDFYNSDGTVLKTIIRSNPGIVLLKGGVVQALWHYRTLPSFNDVKATYIK